jgi:hypothetical protein
MDYNRRRNEPGAVRPIDRQNLIWNGALILLCTGVFALVLLSNAHDAATRCTETHLLTQEACLRQLQAEAARRPAKGAYPPVLRTTERPAP